jgi:hypothetical protein
MPEIINNVLCPICTGWHPADDPCPCEPVVQIPGQLNIVDYLGDQEVTALDLANRALTEQAHGRDGLEVPYEPGPTKDADAVVRNCPGGGRAPTSIVTMAGGGSRGACAGCRQAVRLVLTQNPGAGTEAFVCVPHDVTT